MSIKSKSKSKSVAIAPCVLPSPLTGLHWPHQIPPGSHNRRQQQRQPDMIHEIDRMLHVSPRYVSMTGRATTAAAVAAAAAAEEEEKEGSGTPTGSLFSLAYPTSRNGKTCKPPFWCRPIRKGFESHMKWYMRRHL